MDQQPREKNTVGPEGERFEIVNNMWLIIEGISKDKITMRLERSEEGDTFDVNVKDFHMYYDLGYAHTIGRIQGRTLEATVEIHQTWLMSREQLFTALTRARDVHQLRVELFDTPLEHTMHPSMPQQWVFCDRFPAALYEIKNKHSGKMYRGYTEVELSTCEQEGGKMRRSNAFAAIRVRMREHLHDDSTPFDQQCMDTADWELELLHYGTYSNKKRLLALEGRLIREVPAELTLNTKKANTSKKPRLAEVKSREINKTPSRRHQLKTHHYRTPKTGVPHFMVTSPGPVHTDEKTGAVKHGKSAQKKFGYGGKRGASKHTEGQARKAVDKYVDSLRAADENSNISNIT